MAKNIITTSEGNVRFEFPDTGKIINVHPNHIYTSFYIDTVSFMLIALPKSSGLAIMSSKAEDLEFDGQTYTFDQLPDVITEAFVEAGAQARWEVVDELPASGRSNTIYLVPKEEGSGFDEYIWLKDEQEWELIGDTDIELWRYLKKDDFNVYSAATKAYIDSVSGKVDTEIARATSAETALSTAIFNESVDRAAADNVLSGAIDTAVSNLEAADAFISGAVDTLSSDLATEAQRAQDAEDTLSGAIDTKLAISDFNAYSGNVETELGAKASQSAVDALNDVVTAHTANTTVHVTAAEKETWSGKQDTLIAGENITISGNVISSEGGGGMDNNTQRLISTALVDLNDRKISASEVKTNYQKKGDYATKSELDAKANTSEVMTLEKATKNEQVTASALVDLNNKFGGLSLVKITESEYEALATKDENTLYIVVAD